MALRNDRDKTAHLLRRFGLGASEAEVDFFSKGGYPAAVDRLLAYEDAPEVEIDPETFRNAQGILNLPAARAWWHARILTTRRPLEQALTLFWHHHFATSAEKVDVGPTMVRHVETLRRGAKGRFIDLLLAVSKDPAMLYWLDNHLNEKGKPNENFAREVLELFTLGIGHYTEGDVKEAARAFTGWTFGVRVGGRVREGAKPRATSQFQFVAAQHDDGIKTILGNRGPFDGEDVLGILAGRPETALFLTRKVWEWFVYPDPEPALIDRIARQWRAQGLDTAWLVKTIALSPEFVSDRAFRAVVKNPVQFCASTLRQLGVGQRVADSLAAAEGSDAGLRRAIAPAAIAAQTTRSMGMDLLYPPDVAGWKIGEAWVSTATMVERMKWAGRLFGGTAGPGLNLPAAAYLEGAGTPEALVERILSLFDAPIPVAKRGPLLAAARDGIAAGASRGTVQTAAQEVTRLVFGSPEFQFA